MVKKLYTAKDVKVLLDELEILPYCLDERAKEILIARYVSGEKITLDGLGERYGITRERVRQIEQKSINLLMKVYSWRTGKNYLEG